MGVVPQPYPLASQQRGRRLQDVLEIPEQLLLSHTSFQKSVPAVLPAAAATLELLRDRGRGVTLKGTKSNTSVSVYFVID
jgi:hypothetical protein